MILLLNTTLVVGVIQTLLAAMLSRALLLTSRHQKDWLTAPGYVRGWIGAGAVWFLMRGAFIITLSQDSSKLSTPAAMDGGSVVGIVILMGMVGSGVFYLDTMALGAPFWRRIGLLLWLRRQPHGEALVELQATGWQVAPPGGPMAGVDHPPSDERRVH